MMMVTALYFIIWDCLRVVRVRTGARSAYQMSVMEGGRNHILGLPEAFGLHLYMQQAGNLAPSFLPRLPTHGSLLSGIAGG